MFLGDMTLPTKRVWGGKNAGLDNYFAVYRCHNLSDNRN